MNADPIKAPNPTAFPFWSLKEGMNLKDFFAAAALTGLLADGNGWPDYQDHPEIAKRAYHMAEAMLEERERRQP